jgi:hypothetical protein
LVNFSESSNTGLQRKEGKTEGRSQRLPMAGYFSNSALRNFSSSGTLLTVSQFPKDHRRKKITEWIKKYMFRSSNIEIHIRYVLDINQKRERGVQFFLLHSVLSNFFLLIFSKKSYTWKKCYNCNRILS